MIAFILLSLPLLCQSYLYDLNLTNADPNVQAVAQVSSPANLPANFTAFTICCWVFPTVSNRTSFLAAYFANNGLKIGFALSDTSYEISIFGDPVNETGSFRPVNTWTHACFGWSSSDGLAVVYINGAIVLNYPNWRTGQSLPTNGPAFYTGLAFAFGPIPLYSLNGIVTGWQMYSRRLQQTEVNELKTCSNGMAGGDIVNYNTANWTLFNGATKVNSILDCGNTAASTPKYDLNLTNADPNVQAVAQLASTANLPANFTDFTICVRVFPTDPTRTSFLAVYGADNGLKIGFALSDTTYEISIFGDLVNETGSFRPVNTWTHACFGWSSSDGLAVVYINGVNVLNYPNWHTGQTLPTNGPAFYTGLAFGFGQIASYSLNGLVTDWQMYSKRLPPNEVTEVYTCSNGTAGGDIVNYNTANWTLYNGATEVNSTLDCGNTATTTTSTPTTTTTASPLNQLINFVVTVVTGLLG